MHEGESVANRRIAQPGEPAAAFRIHRGQVHADYFHEQQLADAQQHRAPAGAAVARFGDDQVDQRTEGLGSILGRPDPQQTWERRQHRVERKSVAAEKTADDMQRRRTLSAFGDNAR
jgi:hypothetical protein